MKSKTTALGIILAMVFSFLYGGITIKYRVFPYDYLEWAKNFLVARIDLPQSSADDRSDYYYDKKSFFEQHGRRYDIVMVGDSLIERAEWQDLFPDLKIANRGIGGDTADGVLARMDSICATQAKKAFIMVGTNDFSRGYSVQSVVENYVKIIDGLHNCQIKPFLQSTILASKNKKELNLKIDRLNQALQSIAKEKQLSYIDINQALSSDGRRKEDLTRDGLHLNGEGYSIWRQAISSYMQ